MTTLMISKANLLPSPAIKPPVNAPIAAPKGAAVPITELHTSLSLHYNYTGINVVKKL